MRTGTRIGTLAIAALFAAACGPKENADVDTAAGALAAPDSTLNATKAEYTPAELLGLINAGQAAYTEASKLAATKATDAEVKAFAKSIVDANRADTTAIGATAKALAVTPTLPENDEDVADDHRKGVADLTSKAKGKEWDEAYLEYQIGITKKVLDEVKDALSRNPAPEMRTLLDSLNGRLAAMMGGGPRVADERLAALLGEKSGAPEIVFGCEPDAVPQARRDAADRSNRPHFS